MAFNTFIIVLLILILIVFIGYLFSKTSDSAVLQDVRKEGRIYNIENMTEFIKARMDEITRTNLYDIRTDWRWVEEKKKQEIWIKESFEKLNIWRC